MPALYVVEHHSEEFECPWCGGAVYVGDYAYEDRDGDCYCSRSCAAADRVYETEGVLV